MSACSICAELPATATYATGYGDTLPAAFQRLASIEDDNAAAWRVCPECRAFWVWEDHPQFYGSGNLDEETIERVDDQRAALLNACLREDDLAARGQALFALLQPPLLGLVLAHVRARREAAFRSLVPTLLHELGRIQDARHTLELFWLRDLLLTYAAAGGGRGRFLLEQLEGRRGPLPEALAETLRARLPR